MIVGESDIGGSYEMLKLVLTCKALKKTIQINIAAVKPGAVIVWFQTAYVDAQLRQFPNNALSASVGGSAEVI